MKTLTEQLEELKLKLNFENKFNFNLDIGTAIDAPHSAHWLLTEENTFVLAVEPNRKNVAILKNGSFRKPNFTYLKLNDFSIMKSDEEIKKYDTNKFQLLENIAIDNVFEITKSDFYCTDDRNTGCSSLLKPNSELGLDTELVDNIETTSLEFILNFIGFPKEKLINFVKTDTQGKDFDVVKSLGVYLKNVISFKCEYNTGNQYQGSNSSFDFLNFMLQNDFILKNDNGYDYVFVNKKYEDIATINLPSIP